MREARDRERNTRAKAVGGINEDMADLGEDTKRARDEEGTDMDALVFAEAKAYRLASDIRGVGERIRRGGISFTWRRWRVTAGGS